MVLDDKTFQEYSYNFATAPSTGKIWLQCDYCGKEFIRAKRHVLMLHKCSPKDSCASKECTVKKRTESTKIIHGDNWFNKEKAKATCLSKYGVENQSQAQSVKDKLKQTNIERYGCDSYLSTKTCRESNIKHRQIHKEEINEKIKKTNIERYGTEHFQSTAEWKNKLSSSNLEKYGVSNVLQLEAVKNKIQKTMMDKYDVSSPLQSKNILDKAKSTCISRYGVENFSQTDTYKEKYKSTCMLRYGKNHPMQNKDVKSMAFANKLALYGTLYPRTNSEESKIKELINGYGFNFSADTSILEGKEIDMLDKSISFAIEYCGLYWHTEDSPEPRTRLYHYEKYKKCLDSRIRLITLFEDEWINRKEQCLNFIKSAIGIHEEKIHARKCDLITINSEIANDFYEKNHILGKTPNQIVSFALKHNDAIVGVITLGRHHRKDGMVMSRLAFGNGIQIVGGSARLWAKCVKYARANLCKSIITWSDNRWSNGGIYERLGFKLDSTLPPDYSYVNLHSKAKRHSKQSQKKSSTGCPKDKTEKEWATERGLARIWDCGKLRWKFEL